MAKRSGPTSQEALKMEAKPTRIFIVRPNKAKQNFCNAARMNFHSACDAVERRGRGRFALLGDEDELPVLGGHGLIGRVLPGFELARPQGLAV